MAEGEEDTQEKTEEPTAKRLLKAREEGQLARSQETTIAASVICVASFIYLFGESLFKSISDDFAAGFVFDAGIYINQRDGRSACANQRSVRS